MQRAHDDFQRGLALEFGVGIDRNTTAIVRHADEATCLHLHFDPVSMAGQCLVHGIVDDFGEQVVQSFFISAADVHAGPTANRLQSFKDFDVLGGIAGFGARAACGRFRMRDFGSR